MALRVLTGILMTNVTEGSATIRFNPHSVDGDAIGVSLTEVGPDKDFRVTPGAHVGLREIVGNEARIDDRAQSERSYEVAWQGAREISYLIVGEVDD